MEPKEMFTPEQRSPAANNGNDRVALLQEVERQRHWLTGTLAELGAGVIITDAAGGIAFMNPVAAALIEVDTDQTQGHSLAEILHKGQPTTAPPPVTAKPQVDQTILARYQLLSEQTRDIILFIGLEGQIVEVNAAAVAAYGYDRATLLRMKIHDLRAPSTQAQIATQMAQAADTVEERGIRFETVHRRQDGSTFPVEVSSIGADVGGERLLMSVVRDISERKAAEAALAASEAKFATAFSLSPLILSITTLADGRLIEINEGFVRATGYTRAEALGRTPDELQLWVNPQERVAGLAKLATDKKVEDVEARFRMKDGQIRICLLAATLVEIDGQPCALTALIDITERKQPEERLRYLAEASAILASSLEYTTTLENVAHTAVPGVADWCVIDLIDENGSFRKGIVAHTDPAKVRWAEELRERYPIDPNAPAGAPQVIRTGQPELYPEITDAMLQAVAKNAEELALLRAVGYHSLMVVPLITHGRTLGAITFVAAESERFYSAADLTMAEEVARRAAAAIGNAELHLAVRQRERQLQASEAEIQRLNRDLKRRLDELQTLFDLAPIGIFVAHDPACAVITGNSTGAHMLGVQPHTNASKSATVSAALPFRVLRDGRELTPDEMPMQYAIRHDTPVHNWEVDVVRADGSVLNLYEYALPLHDEEGRVRGGLGVFVDITARKQAEEFLRASEDRFRSAFEQAAVGMAHLAIDGRYLRVNDRLCEILGYTRAELLQKTFMDLTHPDDLAADLAQMERQLAGELVHHSMEKRYIRKDGSMLWANMTASVVRDDKGQAQYGIVVIEDISARKAAEQELYELNATLEQRVEERTQQLEQKNRELERSNRELDQFAYVASHDLRAPLRAITNLAGWISEDAAAVLPPASQTHLEKLRSRVKRMERLLDDLLLFSRAGRIRTQPEAVDSSALVYDTWELLAPPPGFTLNVSAAMPLLLTERVPLETVLRNLLGNAIKHHHRPDGHIQVTAQVSGAWVEFRVSDDGPGIEPQYHAKIFEMFQTLKPRDQVEGSGIGLAVVKKLVESYGGTVQVESEVGQGATFCFTWPQTSYPAVGHS